MRRSAAVLLAAAVSLAIGGASCRSRSAEPASRPSSGPLPEVVFPSGSAVQVELAITPEERAQGLMFRAALPEDRGMLFFGDSVREEAFWMKNCHVPLDIVFLDADRRFVSASYDTPPCRTEPCPSYPSNGKVLFVLEVIGGRAKREKLAPGQRFTFRNLPERALAEPARSFALAP